MFFTLLLFFGIIFIVEGVRRVKATRANARPTSRPTISIFSIFLITMLIGASLIYLNYLNNEKLDHGPYLSWTCDTSTTMTITWETYFSDPNPTFIWGESSSDLTWTAKVGGTNHHHTVTLKGLKPDSTYYYKIPGVLDKITSFKTGPDEGSRSPFVFLFYADTREDNPAKPELHHEENIEQMIKEKDARFVIQAGDMADKYADNWMEQWDYNFDVIRPLSKKNTFYDGRR